MSSTPSAVPRPAQGARPQAEPSLLHRLGSFTLHALSGGYDAASALIPDPIKPLIRGANDLALGLLFDGADKLLPDVVKDGLLSVAERLVDGLDRSADDLHAPAPLRKFLDRLTDFNFQAYRNNAGLRGDWYRLYKVWLTESRPPDLGVWDRVDGHDRVTITDPSYTDDLRSRPQNQDAIDKFFAEHPEPRVGDSSTDLFEYTGPDSAEGGTYTALESFAGSYQTKVTYLGRDGSGEPLFQVEVTNSSHWESGTRVPASGQGLTGGRDYLVPDTNRGRGLGIGGDFDQRFIWTQTGHPRG
jgi:hypothetical protein